MAHDVLCVGYAKEKPRIPVCVADSAEELVERKNVHEYRENKTMWTRAVYMKCKRQLSCGLIRNNCIARVPADKVELAERVEL